VIGQLTTPPATTLCPCLHSCGTEGGGGVFEIPQLVALRPSSAMTNALWPFRSGFLPKTQRSRTARCGVRLRAEEASENCPDPRISLAKSRWLSVFGAVDGREGGGSHHGLAWRETGARGGCREGIVGRVGVAVRVSGGGLVRGICSRCSEETKNPESATPSDGHPR